MVAFDDSWFAEMFERFGCDPKHEENGGAANAVLGGLVILAQSVDWLAQAIRESGSAIAESVESLRPEDK